MFAGVSEGIAHEVEIVTRPLYTVAEAAHLAGVTRATAHRWLRGYEYRGRDGERTAVGPVGASQAISPGASFLDLAELVAIRGFRDFGISLQAVRRLADYCADTLGVDRPLVSLAFKVGGRDVFVAEGARLLSVGPARGQHAWAEVLDPFLATLDYGQRFARRWWPEGKHTPILVDPELGFGLPVVAGSGVRTEIILERFRAQDSIAQIADDFSLDPAAVEAAIRFEATRLAA